MLYEVITNILGPGVYWMADPFRRVQVELRDLTVPEFDHPQVDALVKERPALCERHFQVVELGEHEVGVVYKNGRLTTLLAPATRTLYWRGPVAVRRNNFV